MSNIVIKIIKSNLYQNNFFYNPKYSFQIPTLSFANKFVQKNKVIQK